jgi:hypothetical protein
VYNKKIKISEGTMDSRKKRQVVLCSWLGESAFLSGLSILFLLIGCRKQNITMILVWLSLLLLSLIENTYLVSAINHRPLPKIFRLKETIINAFSALIAYGIVIFLCNNNYNFPKSEIEGWPRIAFIFLFLYLFFGPLLWQRAHMTNEGYKR